MPLPFPLILFIISLAGITIMIWRELILIRSGQVVAMEHSHHFIPELEKIKFLLLKGLKKTSIVIIFLTLKFFIKSSNFIKTKSFQIIQAVTKKIKKNNDSLDKILEKKEASKYLKIISEYRYRIRQMKHRIKEEEGIN